MTTDYMERHHLRPEYIACVIDTETGRGEYRIELTVLGGGEPVGVPYPRSQWVYRIWDSSTLVASGDELRSGTAECTHRGMAQTLADFYFEDRGELL